MLRDGIVLQDDDDEMVFNQYSFCELLKHLLVHYIGISYHEAAKMVDSSHLAQPAANATEAGLLSHEYAYYWAMSLYYGHAYWQKGIPAEPNDLAAYFALENHIIAQYHLQEPFVW